MEQELPWEKTKIISLFHLFGLCLRANNYFYVHVCMIKEPMCKNINNKICQYMLKN